MDTNWAADHLQTIRTLMERSTLYRRALAPVMIVSGTLGVAGSVGARFVQVESPAVFSLYWLSVGAAGFIVSFLLVRRQALQAHESFWSPPTRRIAAALAPVFFVGLTAGACAILQPAPTPWLLAVIWIIAYGCALNAAGFFVQRGIRLFGSLFVLTGCGALLLAPSWPELQTTKGAHWLMGVFFGVFHIGYGIYLYFTEKKRAEP